jgi:hypothetical protein
MTFYIPSVVIVVVIVLHWVWFSYASWKLPVWERRYRFEDQGQLVVRRMGALYALIGGWILTCGHTFHFGKERWGILISAVLTLICMPIAIVAFLKDLRNRRDAC